MKLQVVIIALCLIWVNSYYCPTSQHLVGSNCFCQNKFYKFQGLCSLYKHLIGIDQNQVQTITCPNHSKLSPTNTCVCDIGYITYGSFCIKDCSLDPNSVYSILDNACICNNKYIADATGKCIQDVVGNQMLLPQTIQPFMFTTQITGLLDPLIPKNKTIKYYKVTQEYYEIDMIRAKLQMLPASFPKTSAFVYAGTTKNGYAPSFPGPALAATQGIPTKVKYTNKIFGKHIFNVQLNPPFTNNSIYRDQVPCVPHLHGVRTKQTSDGHPQAYWTALGNIGPRYATEKMTDVSSAVYIYPNSQDPTSLWYHDHAMGVTRLNAYAGLAAPYQLSSSTQTNQQTVLANIYGNILERRFLIINDKTFKQNGDLFYDLTATNTDFNFWVPQFFGNTMLVNGKVWPKMTLSANKYRFVILNSCNARILNIFFTNQGANIPFDIIKLDGNYYNTPISVTQYQLPISSRLEIVLDLTKFVGLQVIMMNNANAPFPGGDPVTIFTSNIMKFITTAAVTTPKTTTGTSNYYSGFTSSYYTTYTYTPITTTYNAAIGNIVNPTAFPAFPPSPLPENQIYKTIVEVANPAGEVAAGFINGVPFKHSQLCTGSTYKVGETYDWNIINLTGDTHPMHIHLINFQLIKRVPFDAAKYLADWELANGVVGPFGYETTFPNTFDPSPYFTVGPQVLAAPIDQVFRDVVNAPPGFVTVVRIKFAGNRGEPFGFNASGMSFVWHCHILEHEDNDMMNYYCLQ